MRRFITHALTLLSLIILLGSCERETKVIYAIDVDNKTVCTNAEQDITIKFSLNKEVLEVDEMPIVTLSNEEWATITQTTREGVTLHISENTNSNRSVILTVKASNHQIANLTLLQYGAAQEEVNHTLMYLFLGTSLKRYFNDNIKDASTAIERGILCDNNRVIFFRQESETKGYIGELCYNTEGGECVEQRLEEIAIESNQITPEVVGGYIAAMAKYAPAKRYGMVCAGHGQAWLPREVVNNDKDISKFGIGGYHPWVQAAGAETTRAYGEKIRMLNITELASAIEYSEVELDYILFDACFMSNIETIYDLRNAANYIIASPCEIMGNGFPYERTLPYLFTDEGNTTDYNGAAESYYLYYRDEYIQSQRCGSIAVFNCAEIEPLADATKNIVVSAKEEYDASKLQTYEGKRVHEFYDFGEWATVVATDSEALADFNAQLEKTVIAKYTLTTFYSAYGDFGTYTINTDIYSGVTTSAPSEAYPNAWRQTNWYSYVWGE